MSETKTTRIEGTITSFAIAEKNDAPPAVELQRLNEHLKRPDVLPGLTYKIKPPTIDHALYVTINDITLNENTEHKSVHPFEIFINSKEMDSYQWIVALTRLVSAVFRKGGDPLFLIEELKTVYDPGGGYFSPKARGHIPSIVAEIGMVIEQHFKWIGLLASEKKEIAPETKQFIEEKRAAYIASGGSMEEATDCAECDTEKSVIRKDGCPTCTACGDSKCS